MLRVDLSHARPGMALALPIRHPRSPQRVLLKVGYRLTGGTLARLNELGIKAIWVQYPSLAFLSDIVRSEVVEAQGQVVAQIASTFEQAQRQTSAKLAFDTYTRSLTELIENLLTNPQAAVFLGDLAEASGDDLMRHSSSVTYLSLLMGLKLEGYLVKQRKHINPVRAKEVLSLGIGAMLHDVGVLDLPEEVRQRYRASGDERDPAWREHPALGYRAVRGSVEPTAATVVLHHHQRFDGSGYAGQEMSVLDGQRIHIFARIVGLAEQFDRLRYPPGQPPRPTVWALGALLSDKYASKFDPEVMRALLAVTPPYPPGMVLRLSTAQWAVAIDHCPTDPCRPTVQLIPDPSTLAGDGEDDAASGLLVDLRQEGRHLFVAQAEGQDVTRFNFPRPAVMEEESVASRW